MPFQHNVTIDDTDANWLAWGELVFNWINHAANRPDNVGDLRAAMAAAGVSGGVQGPDGRRVQIFPYPGGGPVLIPIPRRPMVDADRAELARIAALPAGQRHYPVPSFYARIYGGVAKVDFTLQQMNEMALRRVGEYVVNECC